jgi:hypothetical protein
MIYHFSAKFNDDPHTYHGEFKSIYEPDRINDAVKEKILRQAKNELLNRMRGDWLKEDKDIVMYQVYTHNRPFDRQFQNKVNEMRGGDGSEIILFEYKRK